MEQVILVDENNNQIGVADKETVHTTNTPLHRAFSLFLFNSKKQLLVTQRAIDKKTFPGVWTNSVCGHVSPGEETIDAVKRRVSHELHIDVMDIKEITFQTTEDDPKESKTMMLSYNVRYKLINIYKAYMSVKDYETTVEDQALSMGKRSIRRMIRKVIKNDVENGGKDTIKYGMSFADCINPEKEEELERKIEKELRKVATEKWGIEIIDVYITDLAECRISKLAHSEHPSVKYRHNTPPLEEL